uniref:Arginine biosynthesis bifunctional protein ArgJ, mitochondrial n=1 Tax=Pseudo-nitzschia delicatissima TaxID=44447 RepID=A0A7S0TDK7_9STRA|mmetsp:Transcript_1774/g.4126  ORF Transcript_1774/g.4126 Transcript_1774/m.4126 type:complete len:483 (+) Transcript_1774:186-1634(+)
MVRYTPALFLLTVMAAARSSAFSMSSPSATRSISQMASSADTPETLPEFASDDEYLDYMKSVSQLPKGFATGTSDGTFISVEAPGLGNLKIRATVIQLTEGPTDNWAACFTSNKFPGAPIKVGRKRLAAGGPIEALVINNKVSNVCGGGDGEADAELVCAAVAKALNLESSDLVLPSSTGVIGWRLPAKELAEDVVPQAVKNMQSESVMNAAEAIMTTDRFPKVRSITLSNGARVVGIAKGAGMIEPNMATMLSYILTDATVPKEKLQSMLGSVVDDTFNCLSVDGDESTSDTVVCLASNQISEEVDLQEFEAALKHVSKGLAADIVRNGEGTSHVMRVVISNFPGTKKEARFLGRHIVNSPLFKCAVSGNDPNTGRLAGAIGSYMGKYMPDADTSKMSLALGGRCIFSEGKFVLEGDKVEKELSKHMQNAEYGDSTNYPPHQRFVEIEVDFGIEGTGFEDVSVLGSDLTKEYVVINADYRS